MAEILTYARYPRGDEIEIKPFSSVFLDACFILGYFQEKDYCIELIDLLDEKRCLLYISNTIYLEVVNVLLRANIILDGYYLKAGREQDKIISKDAARIIARELTNDHLRFIKNGNTRAVYIDDTVKGYLSTSAGQAAFRPHYSFAANQMLSFISDFKVRFIELDQDIFMETQRIISNELLNPFDAQHYACYLLGPIDIHGKREGTLDYLFTLDGDFERVTEDGTIIRVAS